VADLEVQLSEANEKCESLIAEKARLQGRIDELRDREKAIV